MRVIVGNVTMCFALLGVFSLLLIGVLRHSVVLWVLCTPAFGWVGDPWSI